MDSATNREGKRYQNNGREFAFCRQDADTPEQFEALANDLARFAKNFGEIPAGFSLQNHACDKQIHVRTIHPLGEPLQGLGHTHSEIDFVEHLVKFSADGIRELVAHHLDPDHEGMPGLQGPGHQIQGFRELFLKLLHAPFLLVEDVQPRRQAQHDAPQHLSVGVTHHEWTHQESQTAQRC